MTVTVDEFEVADPADAWTRAGFGIDADDVCRIGDVGIRLVGRDRGTGIVGWSLRGLPSDGAIHDLDGVPTTRSRPGGGIGPIGGIPCSAGHSPERRHRDRPRRAAVTRPRSDGRVARRYRCGPRAGERDGELGGRPIRQIFFRFGEVIVEVVGSPDAAGEGPSTLWGMTYVVADIDATASFFGDRTGRSTMRCSPAGGSPRCATMSLGCRSGRR